MSHYDEEFDVEWFVLMEHMPSRDLVRFDEASGLELEVAKHVLEAQSDPEGKSEWAAFFGGERQSIYGGFDLEMETQEVLWDDEMKLDDAIYKFREELRGDSVISSLHRLRVPFRVLVMQYHGDGYMNCPSLDIHIAESVELLRSLPPEPTQVIRKRDDGIQIIGRFMGVPEEDNGFIAEADEEFPGCSIGEWESILGRELTKREETALNMCVPYIPRPTEAGFERAMDVGMARLDCAERVCDELGVDLYSYREDVDEDLKRSWG